MTPSREDLIEFFLSQVDRWTAWELESWADDVLFQILEALPDPVVNQIWRGLDLDQNLPPAATPTIATQVIDITDELREAGAETLRPWCKALRAKILENTSTDELLNIWYTHA